MKSTLERKLNVYNDISSAEAVKIIPKNLPEEKIEFEPAAGILELDGVLENSESGLRIRWQNHLAVVEEKIDGKWQMISGIQKLSVEFDVEKALPVVKIERIIF